MARLAEAATPAEQAEARAAGTGEVAAFASTRSGRPEVEQAFVNAELARDHETAAWLATALRIGDTQAEAAREIKRVIRAERETVPLGEIRDGDVLFLKDDVSVHGGHEFMRRGTYVQVLHQPGGSHHVTVAQLPFRAGDTHRVKRGPRSAEHRAAADNCVYEVPRTLLGRPSEGDESAAYYAARPHEIEGDYYTAEEYAAVMADREAEQAEREEQDEQAYGWCTEDCPEDCETDHRGEQ